MDVLHHNRGLLLAEGISFTILGILAAISADNLTIGTGIGVVGLLLIIAGIIQGYRSFKERKMSGYYISLFNATINIVLGALYLYFIFQTKMQDRQILLLFVFTILYYLLDGIAKIVWGLLRDPTTKWRWIILSGVVSLLIPFSLFLGFYNTTDWGVRWVIYNLFYGYLLLGVNMIVFGVAMMRFASALPKEPPIL